MRGVRRYTDQARQPLARLALRIEHENRGARAQQPFERSIHAVHFGRLERYKLDEAMGPAFGRYSRFGYDASRRAARRPCRCLLILSLLLRE